MVDKKSYVLYSLIFLLSVFTGFTFEGANFEESISESFTQLRLHGDISEKPNVVIVSIEATPQSHMPCYGYNRNTTPNLCQFAEKSHLFRDAYAVYSYTPLALAGISTGKYPYSIGIEDAYDTLPEKQTTLAEKLSNAGYRTYYQVGLENIAPISKSYLQGYEKSYRSRERIYSILNQSERPVLIRDHVFGPHYPYLPDKTYLRESKLRWVEEINRSLANRDYDDKSLNQNEEKYISNLYDENLRATDSTTISTILESLKSSGELNNTLVVFVADHGETLGKRGTWGHAHAVERSVRVPLIVNYPELKEKAVKPNNLVSQLDIYPTVMDVANINYKDEELHGRSLLDNQGHSYLYFFNEKPVGITNESYKLVNCDAYSWCDDYTLLRRNDNGTMIPVENQSIKTVFKRKLFNRFNRTSTTTNATHKENIEDKLRDLGYLN